MTTWWLTTQTQYERSIEVYERSGISDSPGLMNNMGYSYAYLRQFDKAFAQMDKYVVALPQDANPQDSYAEILRMAGRFQESIEHYRAALAINPEFYSSQFGIADTYSLMETRLRQEKSMRPDFGSFHSLNYTRYCGRRGKRLPTFAKAIIKKQIGLFTPSSNTRTQRT